MFLIGRRASVTLWDDLGRIFCVKLYVRFSSEPKNPSAEEQVVRCLSQAFLQLARNFSNPSSLALLQFDVRAVARSRTLILVMVSTGLRPTPNLVQSANSGVSIFVQLNGCRLCEVEIVRVKLVERPT